VRRPRAYRQHKGIHPVGRAERSFSVWRVAPPGLLLVQARMLNDKVLRQDTRAVSAGSATVACVSKPASNKISSVAQTQPRRARGLRALSHCVERRKQIQITQRLWFPMMKVGEHVIFSALICVQYRRCCGWHGDLQWSRDRDDQSLLASLTPHRQTSIENARI